MKEWLKYYHKYIGYVPEERIIPCDCTIIQNAITKSHLGTAVYLLQLHVDSRMRVDFEDVEIPRKGQTLALVQALYNAMDVAARGGCSLFFSRQESYS